MDNLINHIKINFDIGKDGKLYYSRSNVKLNKEEIAVFMIRPQKIVLEVNKDSNKLMKRGEYIKNLEIGFPSPKNDLKGLLVLEYELKID